MNSQKYLLMVLVIPSYETVNIHEIDVPIKMLSSECIMLLSVLSLCTRTYGEKPPTTRISSSHPGVSLVGYAVSKPTPPPRMCQRHVRHSSRNSRSRDQHFDKECKQQKLTSISIFIDGTETKLADSFLSRTGSRSRLNMHCTSRCRRENILDDQMLQSTRLHAQNCLLEYELGVCGLCGIFPLEYFSRACQ